jgi:cell division septation protein DedD
MNSAEKVGILQDYGIDPRLALRLISLGQFVPLAPDDERTFPELMPLTAPNIRKRKPVSVPDTVDPNTMLRLDAAARIAFPDGSMSVSAMRRLAADKLLTIYPIAGKHFTTLADIEEMKTSCRVQAKVQGSRCSKPKAERPSGISATDSGRLERAAARASLLKLRESLPTTSSASMIRAPAAVIPMTSRSRTH